MISSQNLTLTVSVDGFNRAVILLSGQNLGIFTDKKISSKLLQLELRSSIFISVLKKFQKLLKVELKLIKI